MTVSSKVAAVASKTCGLGMSFMAARLDANAIEMAMAGTIARACKK